MDNKQINAVATALEQAVGQRIDRESNGNPYLRQYNNKGYYMRFEMRGDLSDEQVQSIVDVFSSQTTLELATIDQSDNDGDRKYAPSVAFYI